MSRLYILVSAFVLLGLVSVPQTFAQSEDTQIVGPVTAKSATSITIATNDKKNPAVVFVVNDKTVVSRGRNPITIEAVEVGETAGVVGSKEDGKLVATLIRVTAKP